MRDRLLKRSVLIRKIEHDTRISTLVFYVPARSLEKQFPVIGHRVRTLKRGVRSTYDSLPQKLDAMLQMVLNLEDPVCMIVRRPWRGKNFFLEKLL